MTALETVISADGTSIAYERTGAGAPLVLIEPCGHYRGHSAFEGLRSRLAGQYTVYSYDRRGRGASDDAGAYAPEREVEDLAALIAAAGSPVFVYGYSSGALLALLAAARQLPVARLALLEPPIQEPGAGPEPLTTELAALVAEGRFSDVVEHFHRSIGVPDEYIAQMRATPAFARSQTMSIDSKYLQRRRTDDVGGPATLPEQTRQRARQNVIFELGYFAVRLGRERVCALWCGDVEIPSDYQGVLYVAMDEGDAWPVKVAREMRAAGLAVDTTKLIT